MKKFLVSLVIIVVAAAAVFYFGWVQLLLPADTYGVMFTKSGGWSPTVLVPGKFEWRWERLIPTNFTLYKYTIVPQVQDLKASGTLPSGDIYSQYLPGKPDFSYTIDISVTFRINPDRLADLTRSGSLTPKSLPEWYKSFGDSLVSTLQRDVPAVMDKSGKSGNGMEFSQIADLLKKQLTDEFPDVVISSVDPHAIRMPDIALYNRARLIYEGILASKTQSIEAATRASAANQVSQDNRFETLKRYGELVSQYPILLKYLALEAGQNPDSITLDNSTAPPAKQ